MINIIFVLIEILVGRSDIFGKELSTIIQAAYVTQFMMVINTVLSGFCK